MSRVYKPFTPLIKVLASLLILCLLPFNALSLYAADNDAPAVIRSIGDAIDAADAEEFERLVDMEAILNSALDTFIQEASRPENASNLPPMLALLLPQLKAPKGQSPVRDLLLGEARNFVLLGISSGAFAGRKADFSNAPGMLAPLFASASMGRKEITEIGSPHPITNGWIVPFVLYDHDNGNEYPLKGRLEYEGEDLKLKGLENMRQLIYQIGEESALQ